MDPLKLAAQMKAKALADLKAAEEMERDAARLVAMAAERGWHVEITPINKTIPVPLSDGGTVRMQVTSPLGGQTSLKILPKPRKGGKAADPNSVTSRSKSESVKIVREKHRPVPLGELMKILAERGIALGGKNPNQALSANLGQCPDLVSTKRGWWLAGEPLPPEDTSPVIGKDMNLPGLN